MRGGLGAAPHRAPAATPGGDPTRHGAEVPGLFRTPPGAGSETGVPRRVQVAGHMALLGWACGAPQLSPCLTGHVGVPPARCHPLLSPCSPCFAKLPSRALFHEQQ